MKLGFWVAPEGSDAALSVVPLGDEAPSGARRATLFPFSPPAAASS